MTRWTIEIKPFHKLLQDTHMSREEACRHGGRILTDMVQLECGPWKGGFRGMDAYGEMCIFDMNEVHLAVTEN